MHRKQNLQSKLSIALLLALPTLALADPASCQISPLAQYIMPAQDDSMPSKEQIIVVADDGYLNDTTGNVRGNAEIFYGDGKMTSEQFTLDRIQNIVTSDGSIVRYATPNAVLVGSKIIHLLDQNETHLASASYYLKAEPNIQGRASEIDHRSTAQNTLLKNATYSTCTVDNEIWTVRAKDIDIDHVAGRAEAVNATFDVLGVPILYTPYLSFPIDGKRHSGLLFPKFQISRSNGVELFIPYYFNIAPNMDAILAPGYITKRGAAVQGNFRYLNEWQKLEMDGTYLFRDKQYDNKKRWIIKAESELNLTKNLTGNILFQNVSDVDYLADLEDQTGQYRDITLERHAVLNYRTEDWTSTLRVQDFIVTDRKIFTSAEGITSNPYGRIPQLLFNGGWEWKGLQFDLDAEFVRFEAKDDRYLNLEKPKSANRIDIMPSVSYRLENSWGFIEPKARFRYTHYDLSYKEISANRDKKRNLSRSLPILSVDAGLFFDRNLQFDKLFGGGDFVQTLEPRLFYLYAPYRSQSRIPIFDTTTKTSSFDNLFGFNDFYGADRQSNANKLAMAFTTRIIEESTGVEKFVFSLGQTRYFTSPRITIAGDFDEGENKLRKSSLTGHIGVAITPELSVSSNMEWSTSDKKVNYGTFDLRYKPAENKIFSIGYRYDRYDYGTDHKYFPTRAKAEQIDQIDASFYWAIDNKWAVVGRYNYAFNESKMIDSQLGVEFTDCCVTTRVAARYWRENIYDQDKQWRVYVEFDISGMGSVGQSTDKMWQDSISGYRSRKTRYF